MDRLDKEWRVKGIRFGLYPKPYTLYLLPPKNLLQVLFYRSIFALRFKALNWNSELPDSIKVVHLILVQIV